MLLALTTDAIGAIVTFRKLHIDPTSESRASWIFSLCGAALAIASLRHFSLETLLFPVYIVLQAAYIVIVAKPGKANVKELEKL